MLTPTTRASLLLRLRDPRDHEAWVEFVSIYEPLVYRLLRRSGLQDADAREIMQELFLAVSRNIDRWDSSTERGSFRGWLRRVARNLVINWLKHRQRRAALAGGPELATLFDQLPAADDAQTAEFDREFRRVLFHKAADQVRGEVQVSTWQAFWETAVLGKSSAASAKDLCMTEGAVRVARCRVLARIKAIVMELENAP